MTNTRLVDQTSAMGAPSSAAEAALSAATAFPLSENQALTYQDMMARLQVPKRTLERLVSKSEIPHKRIGPHVRFYWPDIVDWLRSDKKNGARRR